MSLLVRPLGRPAAAAVCLGCQWRAFSNAAPRRAASPQQQRDVVPTPPPPPPPPPPPSSAPPEPQPKDGKAPVKGARPEPPPSAADVARMSGPLADAPRSYGQKVREFTPRPLARPIGMQKAPEAGENTGVDRRSIGERVGDLYKTEAVQDQFNRPYFREWNNLQLYNGKLWIAPPRTFRADVSLFFPNFYGVTYLLEGPAGRLRRDTTPVLRGRTSVVTVSSTMWGENQVKSFISERANPELSRILAAAPEASAQGVPAAQLLQLNLQLSWISSLLLRTFKGPLRRQVGEAGWDKYFLVRNKIPEEIRERVGLLNSKIGYVFLVDHMCRIRWAGCGDAEPEEVESVTKGLKRLLAERARDEGEEARGAEAGKPAASPEVAAQTAA